MKSTHSIFALMMFFVIASNAEDGTTRILFIGNSYTGQIKKTVTSLIKASPEGATTELQFISPGGKNLEFHLQNKDTIQQIKQGNWDFVVLQDQSQTPAVFPDRFKSAAVDLDKIIDASGAQTVFYQTWGRRDGDKQNPGLLPTYKAMQKKLSDAYESTAKRCDAVLAPVGDTWAKVRKASPELGTALYKSDGSHPSEKGAWLAACVFYTTLFQKSPATIDFKGGLSEAEVSTILEALPAVKGISYPVSRILTNSSGTKIEVSITGRSKTDIHFTTKGKRHVYKIDRLSDTDRRFVETLPINK